MANTNLIQGLNEKVEPECSRIALSSRTFCDDGHILYLSFSIWWPLTTRIWHVGSTMEEMIIKFIF